MGLKTTFLFSFFDKKANLFSILFLLLVVSFEGYAQVDSRHYLPPMKQATTANITSHEVYLSTSSTTPITVNVYKGTDFTTPFATVTGLTNTAPQQLSTFVSLAGANNNITLVDEANTGVVTSVAGLYFESTDLVNDKFYVNYRGSSNAQGDILPCLGTAALGTNFRWGGVPNFRQAVNYTSTSLGIYATEDDTTVTISGYDPGCQFRLQTDINGLTDDTITVILNKGQTFVLEAHTQQGDTGVENTDGWLGANITSDKPIALANGQLVSSNLSTGGQDALMAQPVPVKSVGRQYAFIRGGGTDDYEVAVIVATADNTAIYVNGSATPIATINNGDYYMISGSNYSTGSGVAGGNMYVETSIKAYAYQQVSGTTATNTQGMNFIPPLSCLSPNFVDNISAVTDLAGRTSNFSAITIVASSSVSTITITDGVGTYIPTSIALAGNSYYKTYYYSGVIGDVSVTADAPIEVGLFGSMGSLAGFSGYFSGFDDAPVIDITLVTPSCAPGGTLEETSGTYDSYEWFRNGVSVSGPNTSNTYTPTSAGEYFVRVEKAAGCYFDSDTVEYSQCMIADDDDFSATPLSPGSATVTSVIDNDTLYNVQAIIGVNSGEVTLTDLTMSSDLTLNPDGTIAVNSGVISGTYTLEYQICENGASPAVCDTAIATIVVLNEIIATADDFSTTAVSVGDSTTSVVTNDSLDGIDPVVIGTGAGEVSLTEITPASGLTLNTDGTITVDTDTASGTYTIEYQICENGASPANCDTAIATIVVLNEIIATADDFSATLIAIGESSPSVITNDTLNGAPVTIGTSPGDVSLTGVTVPTGLTLNADGTILVEDLTPSGTYDVVYEICEYGASPVNCDQATVTVVVFNYIDAIDDNSYAVQVASTTATSTVGTVTSNDTINDLAVTTTNTDVTPITTGSLSIDSEGVLSLEPNTTTGTYSITYELCETGAGPANCDTATATVEVLNEIEAVDDGLFTIVVAVVGDLSGGNVLENDTLNGVLVTNANTDVTPVVSGPLSVDSNGNVTIASNALDGTYSITYELCETGADPANCDTAVATYTIITDSDGDGVINIDEITDGTDPYDFCDYIPANITLDQSEAFLEGDCDEDGLSNGDEVGANPLAPFDSNGDGIPDFLEVNNHNLSNSDDDLEIFNGFSPSSDDPYNRVFTIRNIELYPNNTLEIYNRWGVLVYQTKGYGQSGKYFDGTSEGRVNVAVNEKLPSGTYFYVLRYVNSEEVSKERAGYLYINR